MPAIKEVQVEPKPLDPKDIKISLAVSSNSFDDIEESDYRSSQDEQGDNLRDLPKMKKQEQIKPHIKSVRSHSQGEDITK